MNTIKSMRRFGSVDNRTRATQS